MKNIDNLVFSQVMDYLPLHTFRRYGGSLSRRTVCQAVPVSRPISRDGVRPADVPREPALYPPAYLFCHFPHKPISARSLPPVKGLAACPPIPPPRLLPEPTSGSASSAPAASRPGYNIPHPEPLGSVPPTLPGSDNSTSGSPAAMPPSTLAPD